MAMGRAASAVRALFGKTAVVGGALLLTLAFFLVLPVLQQISQPPRDRELMELVDAPEIEPPPPPPEEEPEPPEEKEKQPPELDEPMQRPDISDIENLLNPGGGSGFGAGNIKIDVGARAAAAGGIEGLISSSELDQRPRAVYQPSPNVTDRMRKRAPGTVYVIFIVNKRGRVERAKVQRASDPIFAEPALAAVKQWKFEPGRRNGEPVRFRMRVPITFPKSN